MGRQAKKHKQKAQKQRAQEKDDELLGAALEAQCERLRKMKLSREACGTEDQEHANDDLARAKACGFRLCDVREEAARATVAAAAGGAGEVAAGELREYFDTSGSAPSGDPMTPRDGSGGSADEPAPEAEPCTDERFAAMHAPLEAAEIKRQESETLHRDNGSKRRGQKAVRPLTDSREFTAGATSSSSGFDALGVDTSDESSSDSDRETDAREGVPTESGDESDEGDTELIEIEGGKMVPVEGSLIDAIFAIREAQSYLAPKKVAAKLKQQGFGSNGEAGVGSDLKKIVEAVWAV